MTGATDEIWQAIEPADALPHGRARIARLEELAARADELGDAELSTAVRVSLLPACLYGGEHQRVPALLAWLLQRYDEAPDWFGAWERRSVLFSFNWATVGLLQHPDVALATLEQILTAMSQHFAAAGESMAPVLRAEYLITAHVSGPQAAQAGFEAWVAANTAGPTSLSECADCEAAEQVRQLAAVGRLQPAADLALSRLDQPAVSGCEAHPAALIAASLSPLLETGRADRAAQEHVRAVRLFERLGRDGTAANHTIRTGRADHLLIAARSGRLQRGLDLMESWLPWYARVEPPSARLETAAAAGRLLRGLAEAGHGHLVVSADGDSTEPTTVDELGARLAREARDLGARFDARNGTTTIGDQVERMLDAPPLPELPLDALSRSPRTARVTRPGSKARRGRRAVGRDSGPALPTGNLNALAETFDAALRIDAGSRCGAVLEAWRDLRRQPVDPAFEVAAARLDGWLAIEELTRPGLDQPDLRQAALASAAQATERLRTAGLPVEALLHEQAFLLAAAQNGRIDLSTAGHRIERLAAEIGRSAGPGDAGLALSRLVLIREVAAAAGHDSGAGDAGDRTNPGRRISTDPLGDLLGVDPLDAGLAALDSVPPEHLTHQQLRATCRLLRIRAIDEPAEESVTTLFSAVAVLPDGVRPMERSLAGADLARALQAADPATGLTAWEQAILDAGRAEATNLLGNLLASAATARHALGDPAGAVADLTRAVPLLDEHAIGALAAQARFDLARALMDLDRPYEAAEAAEAALADLTDQLRTQGLFAPVPPTRAEDAGGGGIAAGGSGEVHLAGATAFTAAEANAAIGDRARARELAERSAGWHARNGNLIAQAEAWQLAARLGGTAAQVADDLARAAELAEAGGDWTTAATCRRERITAIKDAEGMEAALAALADADAALGARVADAAGTSGTSGTGGTGGRHISPDEQDRALRQLRWHRLAVAEQRARMLAVGGRFREAMTVVDGLEREYQELGDDWSARDLLGLRGQLRAELDDLDGALDDLLQAAEEAQRAGDQDQAHGLGERLAAVLAEAGLPADAERAWQRFCAQTQLA